jgi:hypothetical protein
MQDARKSLNSQFSVLEVQPFNKRTRGLRVDAPPPKPKKSTSEPSSSGNPKKKGDKRLVLLSRHDPVAPGGYFRYCANDPSSEPLPLDTLLEQYGALAQNLVLKFDNQNDVDFRVAEVVEETLISRKTHVLIRFSGYPPLFDMLFDTMSAPYEGFVDAYERFKALKAAALESDAVKEGQASSSDLELLPMEVDMINDKDTGKWKEEADHADDCEDDVAAEAKFHEALGAEEPEVQAVQPAKTREKRRDSKANSNAGMIAVSPPLSPAPSPPVPIRATKKGTSSKKRDKRVEVESDVDSSASGDGEHEERSGVPRKKISKAQFKRGVELDNVETSMLKTKASLAALFYERVEGVEDIFCCKLCLQQKKSKSNLSNLIHHLDNMHKENWEALRREHIAKRDVIAFAKTLFTQIGKTGTKKLSQSSLKMWVQDGSLHKLAKTKLSLLVWAIKSHLPFYPFDSKEFIEFANQAGFAADSAYLMKKHTATLRSLFQRNAEERLAQCSSVSISADMWTSVADSHYLVMTYHGIDPKTFELVHHLLDLQVVHASATGNLIGTLIKNRIEAHWGQNKHVVALVVDSGANMLKSGKILNIQVQRCFGHGLKGVIDAVCGKEASVKQAHLYEREASLDLITVKAIVELLHMNEWMRKEVLGSDDETLDFVLENSTRWEGRFLALQRFLRLKDKLKSCKILRDYFQVVQHKATVADDILSKSFFYRLEKHLDLLKVFHEISVLSQYENQSSIAWIPSWIWKIKDACRASGSALGTKLGMAIEERLVPKYFCANGLALKAALLNPYLSSKIEKKLDKGMVKETWNDIAKDAANARDLQIDIDSDESKEHQAILLAARPLLQRHMKQWREIKREEAKNNGPEVLLERDASLFDFWRSCRANFALLSIATFIPVASRYLGIPATSAPSERSFSSSGLAVTKLRNRLGHDLLEHILLCRDWILQPCYSFNDTVKALEDAFADEENDKK